MWVSYRSCLSRNFSGQNEENKLGITRVMRHCGTQRLEIRTRNVSFRDLSRRKISSNRYMYTEIIFLAWLNVKKSSQKCVSLSLTRKLKADNAPNKFVYFRRGKFLIKNVKVSHFRWCLSTSHKPVPIYGNKMNRFSIMLSAKECRDSKYFQLMRVWRDCTLSKITRSKYAL